MKIAIDARFLGPKGTGLGTYTQKLIENLEKIDQKNEYIIILLSENSEFYRPKKQNFHKIIVNSKYYSFGEQIFLPIELTKLRPDLVHFCHFNVPIGYRGKFVVTIHDLIKHEFAGLASTTKAPYLYWAKHYAYRVVIANAINHSKAIFVPSFWIKKRILEKFNISENKIIVTYESSGFDNFKSNYDDSKLKQKYAIKKPYLIYVGNLYPYKNLSIVLSALQKLKNKGTNINFFVASPRDHFHKIFKKEIKKLGLENQVLTPGYVPTEELFVLYQNSTAYIFPSLSEGFGIPGLDAMTSQTPLIASDIPVLKEVYSEAALYFNPRNSNDLVSKIDKVINDEKLRFDLVEKGKKQVEKYSWIKMAKETLKVYIRFINQ